MKLHIRLELAVCSPGGSPGLTIENVESIACCHVTLNDAKQLSLREKGFATLAPIGAKVKTTRPSLVRILTELDIATYSNAILLRELL